MREQLTAPEAEPNAPRTPFEAVNGKELDAAISKEFPDEKAASDVRSKIHNLTNVQARELAINLDLDLGQSAITRAKASGGITRGELFKRLLQKNSVADISKAIDASKHLPPVKALWVSEAGEAKFGNRAEVPRVVDEPKTLGKTIQEENEFRSQIKDAEKRMKNTSRKGTVLQGAESIPEWNESLYPRQSASNVTGPAKSAALESSAPITQRASGKPEAPSAFPEENKFEDFSGKASKSSVQPVRRTQTTRQALLQKLKAATEKAERAPWRAKRGQGYKKTKKD